jgi:ABC-type multidrug transport system ATPase subunit
MSAAISIEAKLLKARRAGVDLHPTTLRLAPGRHALVGRQEDGAALLLACMAGEVRLKGGELTVLGGSPRDPKVRARVGFVPLGLVLPDVLRVDETLTLARHIRGEDAADKSVALALAALGIETLARRRVHTLDPSEVRAVALAEVLASKAVSVVLIEEPFATMAAPAAAALPHVLAAQSGKCIVVSTASANDASRVASDFALFDRGRLLRIVPEAPLRETHEVPRMHVLCQDARALAAALAKKPEVAELELLGDGVVVSGKDLALLAAAVNAAIVDTGVEVQRIEPEPASLEALRADALAELAQRTAVAAAVGRP